MSETTVEAVKPPEVQKVEPKSEPKPEVKAETKVEAPKPPEPAKTEPPKVVAATEAPKAVAPVPAPAVVSDPEPVIDSTMVRFEFGSVETIWSNMKAWVEWKLRNPMAKD